VRPDGMAVTEKRKAIKSEKQKRPNAAESNQKRKTKAPKSKKKRPEARKEAQSNGSNKSYDERKKQYV
jgi:hypothetical protein